LTIQAAISGTALTSFPREFIVTVRWASSSRAWSARVIAGHHRERSIPFRLRKFRYRSLVFSGQRAERRCPSCLKTFMRGRVEKAAGRVAEWFKAAVLKSSLGRA
jgi:hypothetical protein